MNLNQLSFVVPNEFWIGQFFVLKKYRRLGVGRQAARFIFDQHPGKWEVGQMPLNEAAHRFRLRTMSEYTGSTFVEHELHDERWDGYRQCFDGTQGRAARSGT